MFQIKSYSDIVLKFMENDYCNDPKFSDRYAWANSADPDQTAPRGAVLSGSTLFAFRLHCLDSLLYGRAT